MIATNAKILGQKRAGISFPLSSILTESSYGVGDFDSIIEIANFAANSGFSILQILPLNDLGFGKSPYSSISAFAIDPIYISLKSLSIKTEKLPIPKKVDFLETKQKKLALLKLEFEKKHSKEELEIFLSLNSWLYPYVTFKVLYEKNEGLHWEYWHEGTSYSKTLFEIIKQKFPKDFYFQIWLQKVAFTQLANVKKYLETKQIYLKGDMPILTSDNSADVWANPNLFNRTLSSGAPPDYFNSEGQNWGFPVINWDGMKQENYRWWKERLKFLENFYHLYRIDHVLGMYRIWAIPRTISRARLGFFHPQKGASRREFNRDRLFPEDFLNHEIIYEFKEDRYIFHWDFFRSEHYNNLSEETRAKLYKLSNIHNNEDEIHWRENGEKILKLMIKESSMIPCAEDLGSVPEFVRNSIFELKLIGLDIIRWTRSFEDGSYITPAHYRKDAVSALSVHDTSTAMGFWKECSEEQREAFLATCEKIGLEIKLKTEEEFASLFFEFAMKANSIFSIHLLQDTIIKGNYSKTFLTEPDEHRINVPGTDETQNWHYVFPIYIESISKNKELTDFLKQKITESKRIL
ncbi:MAG: 4-alpha-glucanotransferase [Leptospiraceae bacterium]|nr:4-alpha-glucanotransferase [Leptospiraceae bacterium]